MSVQPVEHRHGEKHHMMQIGTGASCLKNLCMGKNTM